MLNVLDPYYLAITAIITVAYQLFFYTIAVVKRFDKVTDLAGGTNFIILALVTFFFNHTFTSRQILVTVLSTVWGIRLAGFLLYRILQTAEDKRFDEIRNNALSFLGFFVFQMLWVWIVSLPVVLVNSPAYTPGQALFGDYIGLDTVGLVCWIVGFVVETVADQQKFNYRQSGRRSSPFMVTGVWSWSRHPNYFGEMLLWIGMMLLALPPVISSGDTTGYASIASPLFTMAILFFLSGLPLNERPVAERLDKQGHWEAYKAYRDQTSILVPLPPWLYRNLPMIVKRVVLFEWPMYNYSPQQETETFV
jgi:steroid 5-alpha reductase family enzyme